jgi:hypothetical protein
MMLAFEFVTLAGLIALTAAGMLAASALSWMAWLAVLALLMIQGSDTFLAVTHLGLVRVSMWAGTALCVCVWVCVRAQSQPDRLGPECATALLTPQEARPADGCVRLPC